MTGVLEGALRSSNAQYEPSFVLDRIGVRLLEVRAMMIGVLPVMMTFRVLRTTIMMTNFRSTTSIVAVRILETI